MKVVRFACSGASSAVLLSSPDWDYGYQWGLISSELPKEDTPKSSSHAIDVLMERKEVCSSVRLRLVLFFYDGSYSPDKSTDRSRAILKADRKRDRDKFQAVFSRQKVTFSCFVLGRAKSTNTPIIATQLDW